MYKAIINFQVPGRPEFVEGSEYHLPDKLALELKNRGLIELVEKVEQKPREVLREKAKEKPTTVKVPESIAKTFKKSNLK